MGRGTRHQIIKRLLTWFPCGAPFDPAITGIRECVPQLAYWETMVLWGGRLCASGLVHHAISGAVRQRQAIRLAPSFLNVSQLGCVATIYAMSTPTVASLLSSIWDLRRRDFDTQAVETAAKSLKSASRKRKLRFRIRPLPEQRADRKREKRARTQKSSEPSMLESPRLGGSSFGCVVGQSGMSG